MSSIPLTFDEHQISRTVIGGRANAGRNPLNMSVILLNSSGTHFKFNVFENLLECNFQSVISIESNAESYSLADVSKKFPEIKFIIPLEPVTDGEMINLAVSEVESDFVLILRDTLYIPSGIILSNLAERLIAENCFCLVPRLTDKNKNSIPVRFIPNAEKSHFKIVSSSVVADGNPTVYPFDNIALYNRRKFIQLGGFDHTIKAPYWQNLDFSLRSWLWGEQTKLTTMLQLSYVDEIPVENSTVNIDYLRYFLKNELPRIKNDAAYIRPSMFFRFKRHSSCGYMEARRLFNNAREWVEKNKYRYKMDMQTFIEGWNP